MAWIRNLLIALLALPIANALHYVVTAPKSLRLGVDETVAISVIDAPANLPMTVYLETLGRKSTFSRVDAIITNGKPKVVTVQVNEKDIPELQKGDEKIFVKLVTESPTSQFVKKEVLITIKKSSEYVFIQTDKPLYLPDQKVYIRIFMLDEKLRPSNSRYTLEIRNPNNSVVLQDNNVPDPKGISETIFKLPQVPVLGIWKISVLYGYKNSVNTSVQFEVKEYVLPTFSVNIEAPVFVLEEHEIIKGKVIAKYVYGKPVNGIVNIRFFVKTVQGKVKNFYNLLSRKLTKGEYTFEAPTEEIKKAGIPWFPTIKGSILIVEADVLEAATGNYEKADDHSTIFSTSPYIITFPNSIKDFKPGVPYQMQVSVHYANGKPASNVRLNIITALAKQSSNNVRNLQNQNKQSTDELGRAIYEYDTQQSDIELTLTVATDDEGLKPNQQGTGRLKVTNYVTPIGKSYVWIKTPEDQLTIKVGSEFRTQVVVYPNDRVRIFYLVISRGEIIIADETSTQGDSLLRTISFLVTASMSPSSRLIVYYVKNNYIIADSVRLVVEKTCTYNNGKGIEIKSNQFEVRPGKDIQLSITGEKNSYIGILAVDEALYMLNNKERLTKEKVFNEQEKHDLGCGPGGGKTTEAVFKNAGLMVSSSATIGDINAADSECQTIKRKKREIRDAEEDEILSKKQFNNYTGNAAICCRLGRLPGEDRNMSCAERAAIIYKEIGNKDDCATAFLDCCQNYTDYKAGLRQLGRLVPNDEDIEVGGILDMIQDHEIDVWEEEIIGNIRSYFPETWLFNTYKIGEDCANSEIAETCDLKFNVPHSITTWQIQALGVSSTNGLCVADPLRVRAFKPVFIQLGLPYAAVRGEQIEIQATVFNYGQENLPVTVYMYGVEGLCMGAGPGERSERKRFTLEPNSAMTVTFPVMPLQVADYPIRVIALSQVGSDVIEKPLKVVPEGVPKISKFSAYLDPAGIYRKRKKRSTDNVAGIEELFPGDNEQTLILDLQLPNNYVDGTGKCVVSAIGDPVGQAVETTISGLEAKFLHQPVGCGEQTIKYMAPTVYTMLYLKRTKRLTADIEKKGYQYIQDGYVRELTYKKADGSFAVWVNHESSTWLTAFVAKVFCQANTFIKVSEKDACGAVDWMLNRQRPDGSFYDAYKVHHAEMTGGVQGDASFTAYVLISMMECSQCISERKSTATSRAVSFLEKQLNVIQRPYVVAIVTYALTLAKSQKAAEANEKLKKMAQYNEGNYVRFWDVDNRAFANNRPWVYSHHPSAVAVETSSYALLTQLLNHDIDYSHPIANWLNQQRSSGGAFVSTQDTVIALQALTEYSTVANVPALDMLCNISSEQSQRHKRSFHFTTDNALVLQETEMPAKGKLMIDAKGKGIAALSVALHYNVESKPEDLCKFDLTVTPQEFEDVIKNAMAPDDFVPIEVLPSGVLRSIVDNNILKTKFKYDVAKGKDGDDDKRKIGSGDKDLGQSHNVIELNICAKYRGDRNTNMAILDVGLFTGYKPVQQDLDKLKNDAGSKVSNYELSDRSVILYLHEVSNEEELCVKFRTMEEIRVGKVQPAIVKIYDYYEPSESCTIFYSPDGGSPMVEKICEDKQCICIEGECPQCNPFDEIKDLKLEKDRRTTLLRIACNDHDFVWSGTVTKIQEEGSFKYIHYRIEDVMKEGIEKNDQLKGETVIFTSRVTCKCPELKVNSNYIIMGQDGFQYTTPDGEIGYKYTMDKRTQVYETRPLKDWTGNYQLLQKAFNSLYNRFVIRKEGCDL